MGTDKTYKGRRWTGEVFKNKNYPCSKCGEITLHAGNIYERTKEDIKNQLGFEGGRVIYECRVCEALENES